MFEKQYKQSKRPPNKSNLAQVLCFIENYLPQKKDRGVLKNLYIKNLKAETIKKFFKLASIIYKTLFSTTKKIRLSLLLLVIGPSLT